MKASELIELIRLLIAEHGDCVVTDDHHQPINCVAWELHPNTLDHEFMLYSESD